MSLANDWYIEKYENVSIISPDENNIKDYKIGIYNTIKIFNSYGIKIPTHTVLIFPVGYSNNETPVSYIEQNLIMLFPLENQYYKKQEYIMFQYFHELGHLLTGCFDQPYMWIGELLACSCNYFLYPKDDIRNSFYDLSIKQKILSTEQNRVNYLHIKDNLIENHYLVYNGQYQIQSALFAYSLSNKNFDFISLLNEFISNKNNPYELPKLIIKIICIINYGIDKIEFSG